MPSELAAQQVKTLKFGVRATNPAGEGEEIGDLYFNDGSGVLPEGEYVYESTGWQILGGGAPPTAFPPTTWFHPDTASINTANFDIIGGWIELQGAKFNAGNFSIDVSGFLDGTYILSYGENVGFQLRPDEPVKNQFLVGRVDVIGGVWTAFTDERPFVSIKGYEFSDSPKNFTQIRGLPSGFGFGRASQRGLGRDVVSSSMPYEYHLYMDKTVTNKLMVRVVGHTLPINNVMQDGDGYNESVWTYMLDIFFGDDPPLPLTPYLKEFCLVQDNLHNMTHIVFVADCVGAGITGAVWYGSIPSGWLTVPPVDATPLPLQCYPISDLLNANLCSHVSACVDSNVVLDVCWKQATLAPPADIYVGGRNPADLPGVVMTPQSVIPPAQLPENPTIEAGGIEVFLAFTDSLNALHAYVRTTNAGAGAPGAPGYLWTAAPGQAFIAPVYSMNPFSMVIIETDSDEYVTVVVRDAGTGTLVYMQCNDTTGVTTFGTVSIFDYYALGEVVISGVFEGSDACFQLTINNREVTGYYRKGNLMVVHIQEYINDTMLSTFEAVLSISEKAINPQYWAQIPLATSAESETPKCEFGRGISGYFTERDMTYPGQYYPAMAFQKRDYSGVSMLYHKDRPFRHFLESDS